MPSTPASFEQLRSSCVPAYVECVAAAAGDATPHVTRSCRFVFPPAPAADAGTAAREDNGASVKLRTNGQLQVEALRLQRLSGSNLWGRGRR
jgi:hypothetical protein